MKSNLALKNLALTIVFVPIIFFSQPNKIIKNGFYFKCFVNSEIVEMTGFFINGMKDGAWIKYTTKGEKESVVNFRKGKKDGQYFEFKNDILTQEGLYQNDSLTGVSYYYSNGKLEKQETILNNKTSLTKFYKFDLSSGLLMEQGYIRDEKKDSLWVRYFLTGKKRDIENYKNGLLNSIQTHFYPNGKLAAREIFKEGAQQGKSFSLNEKGDTIESFTYINNLLEGPFLYFRMALLNEVYGEKMIPLFLNGNSVKSVFEGQFNYKYLNGKIAKSEFYINGKLEGPRIINDSIGNRIDSSNYKNNLKHGKCFHYFNSEKKIKWERTYYDGKLINEVNYYETGKKIKEIKDKKHKTKY